MSASVNLSVRLQDVAKSLSEVLEDIAGEPIAFVLVLQADTQVNAQKVARYSADLAYAKYQFKLSTDLAAKGGGEVAMEELHLVHEGVSVE